MHRLPLGSSGQTVSAIGLGCVGMSQAYGAADEAQSMSTMQCALDQGIDFFDTADLYGVGHNEELIGRFLKADQVLAGADPAARAAYEDRAAHSEPGLEPEAAGEETVDLPQPADK